MANGADTERRVAQRKLGARLLGASPAVAVISVGEENPFGHPSRTVLDRLRDTLLFRTDQHGTVRLSTDGDKLWVEAERNSP